MSTTSTALPPTTRPRLTWVSWLRCLAVLGVVSIHNAGTNAGAAQRGDVRPATVAGVLLDIPFIVAVPVFVMVSGALTLDPASFRGPGPYVRKRVIRTLVPLVFWHAAYIAFLQLWWNPEPMPTAEVVRRVVTGRLTPHLYFLWIVLGLSMLAPVLVRWIERASRTEQLVTGAALAALPAIGSATRGLRGSPLVTVDTPWTWWFPYLGLFVLGWALRDVVLRGVALAATTVTGVGLVALLCYQYTYPARLPRLGVLAPVSYYGASVVVASVCLFVVAASTIREDGALRVLTARPVRRVVDPLAYGSLGIYALHVMVLMALQRVPTFAPGVMDAAGLVARYLAVLAITVPVVLLARRVPWLDRVM